MQKAICLQWFGVTRGVSAKTLIKPCETILFRSIKIASANPYKTYRLLSILRDLPQNELKKHAKSIVFTMVRPDPWRECKNLIKPC